MGATKYPPSTSTFTTNEPPPPSSTAPSWGKMGFLLVFFDGDPPSKRRPLKPSSTTAINNHPSTLLSKTQSTLFICALLLFTTLFLFTLLLSSEQPSSTHHHRIPRRILHHHNHQPPPSATALHGMGTIFRRGTKSLTDLIVAHVVEGTTHREISTFIRLLHHSGLLARFDLVLLFDSPESASRLGRYIHSESVSFLRLVELTREVNFSIPGSGLARYMRPGKEDDKEPMWGKMRGNLSSSELGEFARASYGSVIGFDVSELDPENSLSGFLDRVPMGLRRWACYPMLLGRVRRHFKHTMLVDVRNSLILSDPFTPVRNRSSESIIIRPSTDTELTRSRGRRNSVSVSRTHLNPGVIIGGSRGVRRFANAALTEIARSALEHKGKGRNSVTESGLVNQLVHNKHLLKNINMITPTESIPIVSSLAGFNSLDSARSKFMAFGEYFSVVQRGHGSVSIDIDYVVNREICLSHQLCSSVYRDCSATQ